MKACGTLASSNIEPTGENQTKRPSKSIYRQNECGVEFMWNLGVLLHSYLKCTTSNIDRYPHCFSS